MQTTPQLDALSGNKSFVDFMYGFVAIAVAAAAIAGAYNLLKDSLADSW